MMKSVRIKTMTEQRAFEPDWTVAPGVIVLELSQEYNYSREFMLSALNLDNEKLSNFYCGIEPMTESIAEALSRVFNISIKTFLNYEQRFIKDLNRLQITRSHYAFMALLDGLEIND